MPLFVIWEISLAVWLFASNIQCIFGKRNKGLPLKKNWPSYLMDLKMVSELDSHHFRTEQPAVHLL